MSDDRIEDMDYWDEVDTAEVWFQVFFGHHFDRVRSGSGDAWMDLRALKSRLESEGLELVAQDHYRDNERLQDADVSER